MKQNIAGVAPDLLAPAYLDRFVALFGVAARKSLIEWERASTGEAQLALLDASSRGEVVPASTPCVIYIGQSSSVAEKSRAGRWVSHLPAEFTVSDLIDALDRAAVFLMDWTARQKMAAAKVAAVVEAAAPAEQDGPDDQYQLTSWVSLDAPYNTGACVRAMALLTRAPINIRQLCGHSGLDQDTARALITSLNRRGVLRHTAHKTAVAMSSNAAQEQVNRGRPVRVGLIQRLTRWVRIGGRN
ncbi:hypothetical protein [Diaphorobacter caeni]|uniref:hypothetical protein n=1 Tax=Diaphorobacter caeni TaxID=2784387 RepID=UPI00188E4D6B|nr:hypothetical protein [Diaphorobacter caeni]MBF5007554.1 hypothetical protein [Diaphorobacter caeni]